MNYQEIFTRAWKITWKHKALWLFGILASCTSSRSGYSFNANSHSSWSPSHSKHPFPPEALRALREIGSVLRHPYLWIGLFTLLLLIIVLRLAIGTIGRVGVILGTKKAEEGAEKLSIGEIWNSTLPYFWRYLGASLLTSLPFFIFFFLFLIGSILGIIQAAMFPRQIGTLIGLTLFASLFAIVIGILSLFVRFFMEIVYNALVLEDLQIFPAFRRGWEVLKSKFFEFLILAVIVGIIQVIAGILIALPILFIAIAMLLPGGFALAFGGKSQAMIVLLFAGVASILAYLPILWLLSGILTSFTQSSWTLAYIEATAPPLLPDELL